MVLLNAVTLGCETSPGLVAEYGPLLRLISMVPSMRRVVSALLGALPGMVSIAALLILVLYVSAVMATKLFSGVSPEYFGDLGDSLFTLFQVMTGEAWSEVARTVMAAEPVAWIFFVAYIVVTTFTVLNLFIAVAVNAMDAQTSRNHTEPAKPADDQAATLETVLAELRELRALHDTALQREAERERRENPVSAP